MISERKIIQGVAGGGRVLMWDRSVMVALTLAQNPEDSAMGFGNRAQM